MCMVYVCVYVCVDRSERERRKKHWSMKRERERRKYAVKGTQDAARAEQSRADWVTLT
ncbi:hypothetical protein LZ30DRAFT_726286, partial [Colletotrichum cereale]